MMRILGGALMVAMLAVATHASARAQAPDRPTGSSSLRDTIVMADSALFAAFNGRNLKTFRAFFTPDLEFYQDNEGVANYARTMKDFGQMFGQPTPIHRELVPGTLEVYPIKNYGAMEVGRHRFCHAEQGKEDCGVFSFVHIWRRTTKGWKIARVVSYGHQGS